MPQVGAPVGNANAKKAKRWESAITRALAKIANGAGVESGIDRLADQLITAALAGEQWALVEVANRLDGKPAQSLTVSGDDDLPPLRFEKIERVIVQAPAIDSKSI